MKVSLGRMSFCSLPLFCAVALIVLSSVPEALGQSMNYVPVITPYAGSTAGCSGETDSIGDGCLATQAVLAQPFGSVADRQGNLYFSDYGHNVVRRIDAQTGIVTTVVGIASGSNGTVCTAATDPVGDGCPATQATVNEPMGLTFDPFGNLVVADYNDHRVRLIDRQTGIITTLVGTGIKATAIASNTNPTAAASTQIGQPSFLAFDHAGNLYITTQATQSVTLVVAKNGVISPSSSLVYNLAGTGTAGNSGDGGVATQAQLNTPRALAIDTAGNVLVGVFTVCSVRKITSPFQNGTLNIAGTTITTIAGTGTCGTTITNGGQATATLFESLEGGALDNSGTLYLAQYHTPGDAVRTVDLSTGIVKAYAGTGTRASSITASNGNNGPAVNALLDGPTNISFDTLGDGFISGYVNQTIRRVSLNNVFPSQSLGGTSTSQNVIAQATKSITLQSVSVTPSAASATEFTIGTLSGCSLSGALASSAYCTIPVAFKPALPGLRSAPLVLADSTSATSTIGLTGIGIAPSVAFSTGSISTVAGTGISGFANPVGPASAAQVGTPRGGSVDAAGNIYFADSGNNVIRKITAAGLISTVAGNGTSGYSGDGSPATSAELNAPAKVLVDAAGNLFIVDTGNNAIRYVSVDTGKISTIAGTGSSGYSGDGSLATAATFNQPQGIAVDRGGNIYVADTGNHVIRFFTIGGYISTFAGTGQAGYSGDSGPAIYAQLNSPSAVSFDTNGNLYVADTGNGVIRMIPYTNQIVTVAGSANKGNNTGDGGAATSATLDAPSDVVVDAAGEIYIASGGTIRLVNGTGIISTIVGSGTGASYAGEGGLATMATLGSAQLNLMLDGAYNVYISDTSANRVLLAQEANPVSLTFTKQTPGSTGSTTLVSIRNTGNSPLSVSNLSISANFILQTVDSTSCSMTTVLAMGQACTLSIAFSPALGTQGTLTGNVVITDNALNNVASTQTIPLTGVAENIANTVTTVTVNPASLTYGSTGSAMVEAVVSGGNSPTGSIAFTVNGTSLGSVTLTSGKASVQLPSLPAGSFTVTASYGGDEANASSSGSLAITIQPAVLTVTATDASMAQGDTVPTLTYTVAGFINGDTPNVLSGAPTETTTATSSSPAGKYPITLATGTLSAANYSFNFVPGTLTVLPPPSPDFALSISPATLTVTAGQVGSVTVSLQELYGYTGSAQLFCGNLPANVICHFAAATLTGDPSAQNRTTQVKLSIATDNVEQFVTENRHGSKRSMELATALPLSILTACFLLLPARRRKLGSLLGALLLAIVVSGLTSCGETLGTTVAALGTSQITVNASDAGNHLTHSATFTLVVQ